MCKVQMLRALVKQRLTAAAEEIFGLFERTIAEYEEELCRSKEENERQRKLLDAVFNPQLRLHRADVQQLSVIKEEVPPEQQEWRPSLDQEDPEPPHIKEEQEEVRTSQEGEQLQGFTFTVPVKSEDDDDEEKPQLHQIQFKQIKTDADGEDCGEPELARTSDPDTHLQPDTDDSEDWKRTREPQSASNRLEVPVSGVPCISSETRFLLHSCSQCGKRFGNKTNLKVHVRIHTGEKPFNCLVCGKTFAQGEDLRQHMAVHRGKRLRCTVCDRRFIWYQQFKTHKCVGLQSSQLHQRQTERMKADGEDCGGPEAARNSDPDSPLQPATDDKKSQSSEPETDVTDDWEETREPQSGLNPLQNNEVPGSDPECHTGKTSVSSSECATSSDPRGHQQKHNGIHTGEKPYGCSVCGKRFSLKESLKDHMRLHSDGKHFSCSVCNKTFPRIGEVVTHMRVHTGEKPFSCPFCGTRFTHKTTLRQHMRIHTGEKPFSCSVCGTRFARSSTLTSHLRVHTGEKPFSCSVCKASFSVGKTLSKHMKTHTGERPFSCSVCGRRFAVNSGLTTHLRVHTGEKPFTCSVCTKCFGDRSTLSKHMRTHTGEKPFSCSVCGKTFAQKGTLKQHLAVHTEEKPFACSVCAKRFRDRRILRRHTRIHTGERPFSCRVCDKRFSRLDIFKKHKCAGESSGK